MILIYVGTLNDSSGNPRRGWIQLDATGAPVEWFEEGYLGRGAIAHLDLPVSMKIEVTPAEYKRLRFNAKGAKR
jgi:hypothetical protein